MTIFVSYAWTSDQHREWVRLLATTLKTIGYDVLIDADVDYSDSLTGFMERATHADHVLLVVDENYVHRADNLPESGVGIENRALSSASSGKPVGWLAVLMKDNPGALLPNWFGERRPRSHWFNSDPSEGRFPGSEQMEDLWRWLEDRPARRDYAVSVATLRIRSRRLESIDIQRDPGAWHNPAMSGEVHFDYSLEPRKTYTLGFGEYEFRLMVSQHGQTTFRAYSDYVKAVGVARGGRAAASDAESYLTPVRAVTVKAGDSVLLMNEHGALCWIDVLNVEGEREGDEYRRPSIDFRYQVMDEEHSLPVE